MKHSFGLLIGSVALLLSLASSFADTSFPGRQFTVSVTINPEDAKLEAFFLEQLDAGFRQRPSSATAPKYS